MTANVGDLVEVEALFIYPDGSKQREKARGIVLEVRDDGLFIQEAATPIVEGLPGTRQVSFHVSFDDVLAVIPQPKETM